MASHLTRAERSGSIFFRVTGLIRAGHLNWEQRPLWYDVYAAIPPLREPVWDAKFEKEDEPVRKIFYEEDIIRARFYKQFRSVGAVNVANPKSKSISQIFIEQYQVEREQNADMSDEQLFQKTVETLQDNGITLKQQIQRQRPKRRRMVKRDVSSGDGFAEEVNNRRLEEGIGGKESPTSDEQSK